LYSFLSKIRIIKSRRMRLAGNLAGIEGKGYECSLLVAKPEGKRPQGRLRRRWVDNVKMDLADVGWGGVE
jgi:hypothetical protein